MTSHYNTFRAKKRGFLEKLVIIWVDARFWRKISGGKNNRVVPKGNTRLLILFFLDTFLKKAPFFIPLYRPCFQKQSGNNHYLVSPLKPSFYWKQPEAWFRHSFRGAYPCQQDRLFRRLLRRT